MSVFEREGESECVCVVRRLFNRSFFFAFTSVHNSNSKWLELAFVHHDAAHEDCCHLLTIWNMFGAFYVEYQLILYLHGAHFVYTAHHI